MKRKTITKNAVAISKPKIKGKSFNGVTLKKQPNGKVFVTTHRCRSKFYNKPADIPQKVINWIKSTG